MRRPTPEVLLVTSRTRMLEASPTALLIPKASAPKPRCRLDLTPPGGRCPRRLLRLAFVVDTPPEPRPSKRAMARSAVRSGGHWVGYGWFMSFGTVLPLFLFLRGHPAALHLTRS